MIKLTEKIDRVVLNRFLGIPIFLGVIYVMFWFSVSLGGAFIDFFDILFGAVFVDGLGFALESLSVPGWVIALLSSGLGAGIQTIATFLPVVFFMFIALSLLEESGYMARAAFVSDRFLKAIGLPGKALVPMIVGFGCTVPAIMGMRTLEKQRDRVVATFMAPFFSCGARFPVYALFAAAFFPKNGGFVVFTIYLLGIIFAILTGLLLKGTLYRGEPSHFVMELPSYHMPHFKLVWIHTMNRVRYFAYRAGVVIVGMVLILGFFNSLGTDGTFGNEDSQNSVLATASKAIAPVFKPIGVEKDNYPAIVGLFTGIFAKEAVVGTLNGLYGQMDSRAKVTGEEGGGFDFANSLQEAFITIPANLAGVFGGLTDPLGVGAISSVEDEGTMAKELEIELSTFERMRKYFNNEPLRAYAYLLFVLLYFPCVAAVAAAAREIGMKRAAFLSLYLTLTAYFTATCFFQFTVGKNFVSVLVVTLLMGIMVAGMTVMGKKVHNKNY